MRRRWILQRFNGRLDGAAPRMAKYDDESRVEFAGGEFDATNLRGRHDVSGHTNHEEIAESLIEHDLGGHARIGAAQDDREWLLAICQLLAV